MILSKRIPASLSHTSRPCLRCLYSTDIPQPPLLLKIRNDLKTAMKAKDTNRLNVLRALITEVTNAAKTSSPVKSDMQLLSILRKRAAASKSAAEEFEAAGRQDLKEKEDSQRTVIEQYAGEVETIGGDEIRKVVESVVERIKSEGGKLNMGTVLRQLIGPGGQLETRAVEKAEVAKTVKQTLAQS